MPPIRSLLGLSARNNNGSFEYTPINTSTREIRIAIIEPGHFSSPMKCRLESATMNENMESYEALSYVWGSPSSPKSISVNGKSLMVGQNLLAALRAMRSVLGERRMWIDAICINQNDNVEKTAQVKMMKTIYQQAKQVAVWLGPAEKHGQLAFSFLEEVSHFAEQEDDSNDGSWIYPMIDGNDYLSRWEAAYWLLKRPYWRRVWIIQEIVSAVEVVFYCGTSSMPENNFVRAIAEIRTKYPTINAECENKTMMGNISLVALLAEQILNIVVFRGEEFSLHEIMMKTRGAAATNDVDRIFALLAIVHKDGEIDPLSLIDYSHERKQAYIDAVRLSLGKSLDIICLSQPPGSKSTLPSWVPDWSKDWDATPLEFRFRPYGGPQPGACGPLWQIAMPEVSIDGDILTGKGIILDSIYSLGGAVKLMPKEAEEWNFNRHRSQVKRERKIFSTIFEWYHLATSPGPNDPHNSKPPPQLLTALWRTLVHNRNEVGYVPHPSYEAMAKEFFDCGNAETFTRKIMGNEIATNQFIRAMLHSSGGRRFGISAQGIFISVPATAKIGDKLCVILGCNFPVVLRGQYGEWRFVGECYIDGYMKGEAIQGVDLEQLQEFRLH